MCEYKTSFIFHDVTDDFIDKTRLETFVVIKSIVDNNIDIHSLKSVYGKP